MTEQQTTTLRPDVENACRAQSSETQSELANCRAAIDFLNRNLPATEMVRSIVPVAARADASSVCILAITDRRLIFVAPAPQAISMPLNVVTRFQPSGRYIFWEGGGREYSLGAGSAYLGGFADEVHAATAAAVLAFS